LSACFLGPPDFLSLDKSTEYYTENVRFRKWNKMSESAAPTIRLTR
jgi:hypothetical protein